MTHIQLSIADELATLVIANPPQNRIDVQMVEEFAAALDDIGRGGARAVLVHAEGSDFSFGGDIVPWPNMTSRELRTAFESYMAAFNQFERLSIPTVVAVQGLCFGGGLELAIRADVLFAGETARFGHPEQSIGIVTLLGGVYRVAGARRAIARDRMGSHLRTSARDRYARPWRRQSRRGGRGAAGPGDGVCRQAGERSNPSPCGPQGAAAPVGERRISRCRRGAVRHCHAALRDRRRKARAADLGRRVPRGKTPAGLLVQRPMTAQSCGSAGQFEQGSEESMPSGSFKALVLRRPGKNIEASIETLTDDDLPIGDVLVRVHYSDMGYKDGSRDHRRGASSARSGPSPSYPASISQAWWSTPIHSRSSRATR